MIGSMICAHCRRQIPDDASRCPFCGADPFGGAGNYAQAPPLPPEDFQEIPPRRPDGSALGKNQQMSEDWTAHQTLPEMDVADPTSPGQEIPPPQSEGSTLEESQHMWEEWAARQTLQEMDVANPPTPHAGRATRVLGLDPERQKETRVLQIQAPPKLPPNRPDDLEDADAILSSDFEAALESLTSLYRRLKKAERFSFWVALAAFVAAFSPWYHVEGRGLVSGVETVGWSSALLIGAALVVTYLRLSLRWSAWGAILQFLLLSAGGMAAIYYLLVPIEGATMFVGLPATVATAGLAAVSELVGMMSRS